MNLDLLGLFQSPPRLQLQSPRPEPGSVPVAASLRYPLRNHLYRIFLTCFMVCLAIATLQLPFLGVGALIGCAALYWRGLSLNYGPDALEVCWRLHKVARICWSQLFFIEISPRGLLMLCEKDQVMVSVDTDLEEFDALCAVVLRRAPAKTQISPAAAELLISRARLNDGELIELYGPHFLAEPAIHGHLWDPGTDPYESWQAVATTLAFRMLKARRRIPTFVVTWGRLGRAQVSAGPKVPQDCLAWGKACFEGGILTVEVDYQGHGVRVYQCPAKSA
ncbi:hypothetical protein IV102_25100 [bacterium]|nr:hypothetical protein [bacterium]